MRSRSKIVDATLGLVAEGGFGGITIAAVAQAAGVTRQTVYSIFGTREDLVSQAVTDLLLRTSADLRARLASIDNVPEYLAEVFVAGRSVVRANPVLSCLLHPEPGNPVFDTGMIARAKLVARELLSPLIALDPGLEPDLDDIAQLVIRLGLSLVLFDDEDLDTDDDVRRFVTRWVVPALPVA
ncbi:TetR/AcrR family transcriptional regulator [Nocardia blacklockiae]|uniref:TetR/AcrR family transcriptional regulator n=1 Tax=Nocardia blacklockiae TaxID=480036 RepID=UPI001895874D|nr:TetR/AcrR family transcriptional regulator [Nocardia blacklockiae]MBF6169934.1 TetR/AcrR family transcriptional regulator [Nocardia blacklockiae]